MVPRRDRFGPEDHSDEYVSLRDYLESRLEAQQTYFESRIHALEAKVNAANETAIRAVEQSRLASEKRFEATNEWRQTVTEIVGTLVPKSEMRTVNEKVDALFALVTARQNRTDRIVATFVGGIVVLEFFFRWFLNK